VFHLASWHGIEKDSAQQFLDLLNNSTCTCQQSLIQNDTNQSIEVHKCSRLDALKSNNIGNTHLSIPLVARDQQLGVINLLCENNYVIPSEDMELLSSIGSQVSEIVANAWLHLKLVEKEAARQLLLRSLVEAQEDERKRLARELHDGAGQTLTGLLVRLKTIEKKAKSSNLKTDLQTMQSLVSETIEQIRTLAHQLRPAALEQFGLSLALESMVKELAANGGSEATYQCKVNSREIPDEIEAVLYRIAQEGLTNIARHARCAHVNLFIEKDIYGVSMTIEDDGVGFDPANLGMDNGKRHLGLISMRERAEILGGTLDVYTAPGQGTTIKVHVPIGDY
jgi:signal transduction histidine kinase